MAELSFAVAKQLAGGLVTIGHPYAQAAIDATAMDLVAWCKGMIRKGVVISPELQATQVITAARTQWEGWPEKGGTKQLLALFHELYDDAPEFQPWEAPPPPACDTCGDTGWESFERNGNTFARTCRACNGKRRELAICPDCPGKETRLVNGKREPCGRCLTPERRQQIAEWMAHRKEAS